MLNNKILQFHNNTLRTHIGGSKWLTLSPLSAAVLVTQGLMVFAFSSPEVSPALKFISSKTLPQPPSPPCPSDAMQSQMVHPTAPAGPPQPQLQPQGVPAGLDDEPEKACLKTQRSPNTHKTWQKATKHTHQTQQRRGYFFSSYRLGFQK